MLPPLALRAAFTTLPVVEYRKTLFRTIRPIFLGGGTPLSGIGARLHGARFTPKGTFDTIYLAEDPLTAYIEFQNEALSLMRDMDDEHGVRLPVIATLSPHVSFTQSWILDLTRREVRQHLGTDLNELATPWRVWPGPMLPPTQQLAQEAHASGNFVGVRFFSIRNPGGICLAIFEDLLRAKGGPDFIDLDDSMNAGPKQRIP